MSIQDRKYLKENSIEKLSKLYFKLDNIFTEKQFLPDLVTNVFTIHILDVFLNTTITDNYIMRVYANDIEMDSIAINQQRNLNIIGKEYEKKIINPLAKVSELVFELKDFNNNIITDVGNGNACILIRNYELQTEFNDNYNELNPEYNPHITFDSSSSDEEY